ncbi:DUF2054 domain-containing protein [Cucumis melo var. makuwa]|uniref:SREBP regulating gene protein n=1 Tax=Cucumis melo var. makuwa TaxID=1194695 RepID=A0A5D3D0G6_CUCMM|nr:DUF2054 domain-containing protein [Cucumis melo var. makuwa]
MMAWKELKRTQYKLSSFLVEGFNFSKERQDIHAWSPNSLEGLSSKSFFRILLDTSPTCKHCRKDAFVIELFLLHPLSEAFDKGSVCSKRLILGSQSCRIAYLFAILLLVTLHGYVCDALSVDPLSRCCHGKGEKFPCHGCNLVLQCCNSYEYCVSCCQNPSRTKREQILKIKIAKPATAGTYASIFDFCVGRCRHNSESVVHENAYHSAFHHCFSLPSYSSGDNSTQLEFRLSGINVIIGRQGESCDSVCKSNGQSCVPNKILVLNHCDIMQKYLSCKGGCLASVGTDQPAEVAYDAPKELTLILGIGLEDYEKNSQEE